jgi:AGCS family alanine or glycine:cation symporter
MVGLYLLMPVVKKQLKRYLDAINLKKEAVEE